MRGLPEQRVTWHLDNWAEWQRDQRTDYGYGFANCDGSGACSVSSKEFDAMVAEADMRCAQVVDVVISDLVPIESAAIKHFHVGAVFRFPRGSATEAYIRARAYLSLALCRRGIE